MKLSRFAGRTLGSAGCWMVVAWMAAPVPARAQVSPGASGGIQISSAPAVPAPGAVGAPAVGPNAARDPHPTTYVWSGDVQPVVSPINYHTFFYTGTVTPDATASFAAPIRRIAVPNDEFEAVRGAIVDDLTAFFERAFGLNQNAAAPGAFPGAGPGAEQGGGFDPQSDAEPGSPGAGGGPGAPVGLGNVQLDPRGAAEWQFYLDQFVLWQFYCKRVLLNEPNATTASSDAETLRRRAELEQLHEANPGIAVTELAKLIADLRQRQQQQQPGAPAATGLAAAKPVMEFDVEAIWANSRSMDIFHTEFVEAAESLENRALGLFHDMLSGIEDRRVDQANYEAWLDDRRQELIEFAEGWGAVQEGSRMSIDDTFYLLTREPLRSVPFDSVNIIVGDKVTPQDILNRNGQPKGVRTQASLPMGVPTTTFSRPPTTGTGMMPPPVRDDR